MRKSFYYSFPKYSKWAGRRPKEFDSLKHIACCVRIYQISEKAKTGKVTFISQGKARSKNN